MMYCVKCRQKREGTEVVDVTMKNGKKAKKGKCEVCGTTMFKIGGSAGPSALVMVQNRSEEDQEGRKNVRRYGYGYFLEGNLKIELLRWFSDEYTRKVFQQYSMTNTFITISVRKVHYNNFSSSQRKFPRNKDIKVEGKSFGIGLAYEFL